jgi:hypothetical protein
VIRISSPRLARSTSSESLALLSRSVATM